MNNLLSYCGLVDAKIKASDKDLPVCCIPTKSFYRKGSFSFFDSHCISLIILAVKILKRYSHSHCADLVDFFFTLPYSQSIE